MTTAAVAKPRITARVNPIVRETIARAAGVLGFTENQFIAQAALEKAQKVLQDERAVKLSLEDSLVFFSAMEQPPEASEALKKAAKRHRELVAHAKV